MDRNEEAVLKALSIHFRMLGLEMDRLQRSKVHKRIGELFLELSSLRSDPEDCKKAVEHFDKSILGFIEFDQTNLLGESYLGLGLSLLRQIGSDNAKSNLIKAISAFNEGIKQTSHTNRLYLYTSLHLNLGDAYLSLCQDGSLLPKEVKEYLNLAVLAYKESLTPLDLPLNIRAEALTSLGTACRMLGEHESGQNESGQNMCSLAVQALKQAIELYEIADDTDKLDMAKVRLGNAYLSLSHFERKLDYCTRAVQTYVQVLESLDQNDDLELKGTLYNNLAAAYLELADMNHEERFSLLKDALNVSKEAVAVRQIGSINHASACNNMGNAYLGLAEHMEELDDMDRATDINIRTPSDYLNGGLTQRTDPVLDNDLASSNDFVLNNDLASSNDSILNIDLASDNDPVLDMIRCAIESYLLAVSDLKTLEWHKKEIALTYDNLAEAYLAKNRHLDQDRFANQAEKQIDSLKSAIEAWSNALEYYKIDNYENDYARIKHQLGLVNIDIYNLSGVKASDHLKIAIDCCCDALKVYDPNRSKSKYASVQMDMAMLNLMLAEVEDELDPYRGEEAVKACNAALEYYTPDDFSEEYGSLQVMLRSGLALSAKSPTSNHQLCWRMAAESCRKSLSLYDPKSEEYKSTQIDLGRSLLSLSQVTGDEALCAFILRQAIVAFEAALFQFDYLKDPIGYANCLKDQGYAYASLAALEHPAENYRKAFKAYKKATRAYTGRSASSEHEDDLKDLIENCISSQRRCKAALKRLKIK